MGLKTLRIRAHFYKHVYKYKNFKRLLTNKGSNKSWNQGKTWKNLEIKGIGGPNIFFYLN